MAASKKAFVEAVRRKITPVAYAKRLGVCVRKVHFWIATSQLRAFDASTSRGERPRYLIDEDDIRAFEESRMVVPPAPRVKRRSTKDINAGEFY